MKISACSILYRDFPDRKDAPIPEAVKAIKAVGFDGMEVDLMRIQGTLDKEDWLGWAQEVRNAADEAGLEIVSAHTPIFNICMPSYEYYDYLREMTRRAIVAASIMGAGWAVIHPGTVFNGIWDRDESLKSNIAFLVPMLELARKHNIGIALENVYDWTANQHEFAAETKNLCDLVDALADEHIGICWDFGHSNLVRENQAEAIRYAGKRIKTLHVHDNNGIKDEHLIPFMGTIDWNSVTESLKYIGFDGPFNMETHHYVQMHPSKLRPSILKFCKEVGEYLMEKVKN